MESAVSTLCFPWDKGLLDRTHSLPEPLFGQSLSLNKHNGHGSLTLPASGREMKGGGQAKPTAAGQCRSSQSAWAWAQHVPSPTAHPTAPSVALQEETTKGFTPWRTQTNLCCTLPLEGDPGLTRVHTDPPEHCTLSRSPPQPRQTTALTASVTSVSKAFLTQSSTG